MKSFRSIALVLCMTLLVTLSCREELFELAGDHDIRVFYSDGDFEDPHTVTPTFVRELSGSRVEIETAGLIYLQITNASSDTVELLSVEWISGPLIEISFSVLPALPAIPPYDFSIDYTGADDESDTFRIVYRTGGSSTRELFVNVEGYL
jgi:hypothetical protein